MGHSGGTTMSMSCFRAMAVAAAVAAAFAGCGPKSMKARIADGERLSDRAGAALREAEQAMGAGQLDRAEERLKDADKMLSDPDVMTNPESDMLKAQLTELNAKLPALR